MQKALSPSMPPDNKSTCFRSFLAICAAIVAAGIGFTAEAEVQPNAIGLRGGVAAEINYQRAVGQKNRLEIGVNWSRSSEEYVFFEEYINRFGAACYYQWHWNISPTAASGGFNWYAGPGGGIGFKTYSVKSKITDYKINKDPEFLMNIGGQVGIEYDFNAVGVPINASIDLRSGVIHIDRTSFDIIYDVSVGVRYTF